MPGQREECSWQQGQFLKPYYPSLHLLTSPYFGVNLFAIFTISPIQNAKICKIFLPNETRIAGLGIGHRNDEADAECQVANDLAQELIADYLTGDFWPISWICGGPSKNLHDQQ